MGGSIVLARRVGDNPGDQLAAAFQHPENDRLVAHAAAARAADRPPMSVSSISTVSPTPPIGSSLSSAAMYFADLVAHAPCGLVGDANLALDFLGGNAVPRRREQEHDVEPIAQGCARAIERRAGGRIKLIGAPLALVGPAAFARGCTSPGARTWGNRSRCRSGPETGDPGSYLQSETGPETGGASGLCSCHATYVLLMFTCVKGISTIRVKACTAYRDRVETADLFGPFSLFRHPHETASTAGLRDSASEPCARDKGDQP